MSVQAFLNITNETYQAVDHQLYVLRALFYLVHPNETYYKELDEVPDLVAESGNWFLVLMMLEQIVYLIKEGRFNGRLSDGITSISAGIIHVLPVILSRQLHVITYDWIYKNFLIYDMGHDNVWSFLLTFLFVDMMYYWFHRAAHEVNLFWAAHQTHHSSEDYNLSTAFRQSIFQKYTSWFFYLPLAFFVPPSTYLVHTYLNLVYQFWIHTEIIGNLGPLEYILNTASHHRVHHGRNPYCIDKNYAGVLIIWDRMFGTFAAERVGEELAYGLVHPVETFNPTYLQIFNYQYLMEKSWAVESYSDKLSVLFKGPGWVPGSGRLGNHEDLPKIEYPIVKKGIKMPLHLNLYVLFNFMFVFVVFVEFNKAHKSYPGVALGLFIVIMMYSLTCFGKFFDGSKTAAYYDLVRCVITLYLTLNYKADLLKLLVNSEELYIMLVVVTTISFVLMLTASIRQLTQKQVELKTDLNNNLIESKNKAD